MSAPVVIVGASVAGASCALGLARAGVASVVLERRKTPPDKVCGEGLQPAGRAALEALVGDLASRGRVFDGFELRFRGRPPLQWTFPGEHRGLGIDRRALHGILWSALEAEERIDFRPGSAARDVEGGTGGWRLRVGDAPLRSDCLVAADGAHSGVLAAVGLHRGRRRGRWGARARYRAQPPARVRIHFGRGFEVYLTPVDAECTSVAVLAEERRIRGLDAPAFEGVLRSVGALPDGPRLDGPALLPHAGPRVGGALPPGLFPCGDAALLIDPISGAGMTVAALSGGLVADALARIRGGASTAATTARYRRSLGRAAAPYRHLARALRLLARSGLARRGAEFAFHHRPSWIRACARPTFATAPPKGS